MTIKTKLTSLAAASAIAASTFTPLAATSAQAGGLYEGNGAQLHYVQRRGKRKFNRNRANRRNFARNHRRHANRHHAPPVYYKKKKNRTGKYIAIGLGALMLGIIASQASRSHYRSNDYYDYDY